MLIGESNQSALKGFPMALIAVAGIKETPDKQWRKSSDHQESAERAAHILRILVTMRQQQDRPIRDERRGILLDTYG
jgi:hypothetical protein